MGHLKIFLILGKHSQEALYVRGVKTDSLIFVKRISNILGIVSVYCTPRNRASYPYIKISSF